MPAGGPCRARADADDDGRVSDVEVREVSRIDDDLRAAMRACWIDVTNAGGAVGFVPPVTEADVEPALEHLVTGVHERGDVLVVLTVDGELAGFAGLVRSGHVLKGHWATVLRVQVHPSRQGAGLGRVLMEGVHEVAHRNGLEFVHLTVRGGTGTQAFYDGLGYREVGRIPNALRVAPGDDRDEISMIRPV
jgi:GNAT superfamily N-acetyltransferase